MMGKSLEFLGIARKANALAIGEEPCSSAVASKKAKLLISAADASDNSKRNAGRMAELAGAPHIMYVHTKDELGMMLGRGSPGILAITDAGLAAGFVSKLAEAEPGRYDDLLAELNIKAARTIERRKEALKHEKNVRTGKKRRNNI